MISIKVSLQGVHKKLILRCLITPRDRSTVSLRRKTSSAMFSNFCNLSMGSKNLTVESLHCELSIQQKVHSAKISYGENSYGDVSLLLQFIHGVKKLDGVITTRRTFNSTKITFREKFIWWIFLRRCFPTSAIYPWD